MIIALTFLLIIKTNVRFHLKKVFLEIGHIIMYFLITFYLKNYALYIYIKQIILIKLYEIILLNKYQKWI